MAFSQRFCGRTNTELVQYLTNKQIMKSVRVIRAMKSVDRGNYVDSGQPYVDAPQGIGYGVTISAPHMHAHTLQLFEETLQEGGRALDVGSGSGYLTACFALMLGPDGVANGMDIVSEVNEIAVRNITKDHPGLLDSGRVKIILSDGRIGWPEGAPYDVINVGAAETEPPTALIEQLAPGGRLIIPLIETNQRQTLVQFDKLEDGRIVRKSLMNVCYGLLKSC